MRIRSRILLLVAAAAWSAPSAAQPSPAEPTAPAAETPPKAAEPPPPETLRAPPPPVAPAPSGAAPVELTTLRLLRDKGLITAEEYDSAVKDISESLGTKAPESNTLVVGKFAMTLYGFVEADTIYDTTESYAETAGNTQVARPGTYAGDHARATFTVRNSRIGLRSKAPEYAGIRTSAQLEMDFLGTQLPIGYGQPYFGSESANFTNPTFRARHLFMKLETSVVDVLIGQYWDLFGWQSMYHPNTVEIQGVPGELYSRTPQLRVSKTIHTGPISIDMAIAALRPPQRDSARPEGQAGLRLSVDKWTGVTTNGSTSTNIAPASLAVSGDVKRVSVPEFSATPANSKDRTSGAIAVDAFLPVLPGTKSKMGNALSLNGEFAAGHGTSDLYTGLTGGITYPTLPNPTNASPAPTWPQNIDNGIAVYDANGGLHFVQWTSWLAGVQYYLPGLNGRVWVSGNYSRVTSTNTNSYGPPAKVRKSLDWFDVNLFTDVTPSVRFGLEYANFNDVYADGLHAINHRGQFSAFYIF